MAVTGNVKISELETHAYDLVNGTEMFPISFGDTPNTYESYKMYLKDMASFTGSYLGVAGIKDVVDKNSDEISYIQRDFGQYTGEDGTVVDEIELNVAYRETYIHKDGTLSHGGSFSISQPIDVKKGMMYLLELNVTTYIPDDYCLFAKRREYNRVEYPGTSYVSERDTTITYPDGTQKTITIEVPDYIDATSYVIYEPCSFHYGYGTDGAPKSNYAVFVADEDAQIVCSADYNDINFATVKVVQYGVVSETTEKYIPNNAYLGMSIAEVIASLDARIAGLEQRVEDYRMPTYMGEPIIRIEDHDPCTTYYYVDEWGSYLDNQEAGAYVHSIDQPGFVGQFWVNTYNKNLYIATELASVAASRSAWKLITN